jgi:hypothetical protein
VSYEEEELLQSCLPLPAHIHQYAAQKDLNKRG